ncbi:MAG: GNAT family N-acetyltransferase [Anaerovoracaceae bacterium]|jgi:amino-acid N-acetyltransferase
MSKSKTLFTETDDYDSLVEFYIENGLELTFDDPLPVEIIKAWKCTDEDYNLIGGCTLAIRDGVYVVDCIAVDKKHRKQQLGSTLLQLAIKEAEKLGCKKLFLVAKIPEFFETHGFKIINREGAPEISECFRCPNFGKSCFPEVMQKNLI